MAETTAVLKGNVLPPTRYVVLAFDLPASSWSEIAAVSARSAEAAIRDALSGDTAPAGQYVAVPARSWKPVTVSAVQSVVLKLEEAS